VWCENERYTGLRPREVGDWERVRETWTLVLACGVLVDMWFPCLVEICRCLETRCAQLAHQQRVHSCAFLQAAFALRHAEECVRALEAADARASLPTC
jgi:hypothetical protein